MVQIKVVEGDRERIQAYEGVVIARSNRGFNSSFTVRKISHGEGVERTFQSYSPAHHLRGREASRQRTAREALLSAGSRRQGSAHRREGLGAAAWGGRPAMRFLHRCFCVLWRALDGVRRVLQLLLLLALLALGIGAYEASQGPRVPPLAALVVRPSGQIVEQLSGEPVQRAFSAAQGQSAPQTLLWDLTTAIRAAGADRRIGALVLQTDDLDASGQVKLEELADAIRDFRRSGKKVIAYGHNFTQSQYLLAAQADEVIWIRSARYCWTVTRAIASISVTL